MKSPYMLTGVWVHQGKADAGHYWTYVYDTDWEMWRKLEDKEVSIVDEEEVFENAFGGKRNMIGERNINAYCIIYTKEETIRNS